MGSTRIKGSALSLTFGGVDYWADVTEARITNVPRADPGRTYNSPAVTGLIRQWMIKGRAIQSLDSNSFWRYAWANVLNVVDFRYAPLGNHEPSLNAPHFVGQVQVGPHPTVGGAAGNGEYEFEFEWEIMYAPRLDDGTTPTN